MYAQLLSNSAIQYFRPLNFEKLVIQRISLLMFKYSHGDVPVYCHIFINEYHNYNTRNCGIHDQLAQLKQVINFRLPRDTHLESHFTKNNTIGSYPCFSNRKVIYKITTVDEFET